MAKHKKGLGQRIQHRPGSCHCIGSLTVGNPPTNTLTTPVQDPESHAGQMEKKPNKFYLGKGAAETHPEGASAALMGTQLRPKERATVAQLATAAAERVDVEIVGKYPQGTPAVLMGPQVCPKAV